MKHALSVLTLCLVVLWLTALANAAEDKGGGGLAGLDITLEPDPSLTDEPRGQGAPATLADEPEGKPAPGSPPPPSQLAPPRKSIDERVAELEKQCEALRKKPVTEAPPVGSAEEARKILEALKETRRKARENLAAADTDAGRASAQRHADFDEGWVRRLEGAHKGLTTDDLLTGRIPPGMDPELWAFYCDQYFRELAALEADTAETARSLDEKRKRETAALDHAIAKADEALNQWESAESNPRIDKLRAIQLGMRLRDAQRAAAELALADLKKLQAELKGQPSARSDEMISMTYKSSGYFLPDAVKNKVWREMTLADCSYPPPFKPQLPLEGLGDPPEWMGERYRHDRLARQRAKVEFLAEQLRLARQHLAMVSIELGDEDAAAIRGYAEGLEQDDRDSGVLADPAAIAHRRKMVAIYTKELETSRRERMKEREERYAQNTESYQRLLREESAILQEIEAKAAADAAPPEHP